MVLVVKNPPANAGRHNRCGFHPWVGNPVPSTPERREGLRACYWEGPSELPERRMPLTFKERLGPTVQVFAC